MPPSVHSPSPDHARHVHEEPLQSGAGSLQPKVINKRPTTTSTTAGANAPTTTGVESPRPSSLSRTPSVTPPSSTEVVGPVAVRRRKVGSAQASSERPLVQRKKRSVPGNNVDAGRPSTESSSETTTTTPSTTIQGSANNISGESGAGASQISTMGMYGSPYGLGMSPYGGMGMYGMGMYGGGMMMGGAGPFSGLNNFLFGFQSVVFSLGQAMQILGMNTHALQQLFHTAMSFFDNAISTLNEIRALNIASASDEEELSEEEIKRRRRLKALRWSLVMGVSYAGYKLMRRWLLRRRQLRHMITTGVNPGQSVDAGMGGGEPTHANRYSPRGPPAGGSSYGYGSSNNLLMNGSQYGYDGFGASGGAYGSRYSPFSSSYGGAGNYGGYGGYSGGVNDGAGYFPGY